MAIRVAYLAIGDEILLGQTVNTNASYLGLALAEEGIEVDVQWTVRDTREAILDGLTQLSKRADVILMTGGLGPTKDDITKKTLSEYFGAELVIDEAQLERVRHFFEVRKREILEVNIRQAEVVRGCEVIANYNGTSPGMWLEKEGVYYVSMPGVPHEMRAMMQDFVMPKLRAMKGDLEFVHRTLLTQGIGESFLAQRIEKIEDRILADGLGLAYLPSPGIVKLRITSRSGNAEVQLKKIDQYVAEIKKCVPEFIFGEGSDTLEEICGRILLENGMTVGFVESCTGGKLGAQLGSVPGASAYYLGSIVSYAYSVKEGLLEIDHKRLVKEGAVSSFCAGEMAKKGRELLGCDICISTTGIAGPTGGTPEKPVGLVWFGLSDANGVQTWKRNFGNNRTRNIQMAVNEALRSLQKHLEQPS